MRHIVMATISILLLSLLPACSLKKDVAYEVSKQPEVYFSPKSQKVMINIISNASLHIHCAFYELTNNELISILSEKSKTIEVKILVDDHKRTSFPAKIDKKTTTMHNKFCIIDGYIVITGSTNPTDNCFFKNDNNLLVIYSKFIADEYEKEFQRLWNRKQGKYKVMNKAKKFKINEDYIEVIFCPQDFCADKVSDIISSANKSVEFMAFSLTNEQVIKALLKKHNQGIKVIGVMERSADNRFDILNYSGMQVYWDKNPAKMHHKVFIIDGNIVITGSFNPTKNGDINNDENIIIIHSQKISKEYQSEFERLIA